MSFYVCCLQDYHKIFMLGGIRTIMDPDHIQFLKFVISCFFILVILRNDWLCYKSSLTPKKLLARHSVIALVILFATLLVRRIVAI